MTDHTLLLPSPPKDALGPFLTEQAASYLREHGKDHHPLLFHVTARGRSHDLLGAASSVIPAAGWRMFSDERGPSPMIRAATNLLSPGEAAWEQSVAWRNRSGIRTTYITGAMLLFNCWGVAGHVGSGKMDTAQELGEQRRLHEHAEKVEQTCAAYVGSDGITGFAYVDVATGEKQVVVLRAEEMTEDQKFAGLVTETLTAYITALAALHAHHASRGDSGR